MLSSPRAISRFQDIIKQLTHMQTACRDSPYFYKLTGQCDGISPSHNEKIFFSLSTKDLVSTAWNSIGVSTAANL